MKIRLLALLAASAFAVTAAPLHAQNANGVATSTGPGAGTAQFVIKAINVSTPKTPEFSTVGGETQSKRYTLGNWIEMETEFSCSARTAELNVKYFVVLGTGRDQQMLVGDETLVDVPAGPSLFTAMYLAPRTIATLLKNAPLTVNSVQNIAVQILRPGVNAPVAIKLLKEGGAFYNTLQQVPGFVLIKPRTPFANLWWDRYEQVKAPDAR